jgi:histidine triad (HIT) family protein
MRVCDHWGMDDCLFCRIVAGDVPSTRPYEDEAVVAIMDIFPATRGHVLVIPRAHAADVHDVDDASLGAAARAAKLLAGRATAALRADGVTIMQSNGAAAWQTVFHYHLHVIPRYAGDPLRLPWTPGSEPADAGDLAELADLYRSG